MQPSLVKYNPPTLSGVVGKHDLKKAVKVATADHAPVVKPEAEDVLNSLLPPREWTEGEKIWLQYVSTTPATRLDVVNLQDELDKRLKIRQARETGICPIREELYAEAFDEVIRQVAIICTERGILLLKARDELRMYVKEYRSLYESSIAFGMRKALQAEFDRQSHAANLVKMEDEIKELQAKRDALKNRIEVTKQKDQEREQAEEAKHAEEAGAIKEANASLKAQLEGILSIPKKLP